MNKALVLLNMGGPNSLDEVEVFLTNMFHDENIITTKSNIIRSFISFMIVTSRKREARKNYAKLGGKSPIIDYTKKLVAKLQLELQDTYVTYAMRYTSPFSSEVAEDLKQKNITEVTLLPLYPHYSTTTTKSSIEDFKKAISHLNIKVTTIERFYHNKTYNELLVDKIEDQLKGKDPKEFELIFSAHSLPQKIVNRGDTYQKEVLAHVELLKTILNKKKIYFKDIHVAYQSKLGPIKWLEPSLEEVLKALKCKKTIISPISFTIDNSETEFELSIEYKELADKLGFNDYLIAKCPNYSNKFINTIKELLLGWR